MEEQELPLPLPSKRAKKTIEQNWEMKTTKLIAYNFSMLFIDGKKIACLQNGYKVCSV